MPSRVGLAINKNGGGVSKLEGTVVMNTDFHNGTYTVKDAKNAQQSESITIGASNYIWICPADGNYKAETVIVSFVGGHVDVQTVSFLFTAKKGQILTNKGTSIGNGGYYQNQARHYLSEPDGTIVTSGELHTWHTPRIQTGIERPQLSTVTYFGLGTITAN